MKFYSVVKVVFTKKLIFKQTFKGNKEENVQIAGVEHSRKSNQHKSPEAGKPLDCLRNCTDARGVKAK